MPTLPVYGTKQFLDPKVQKPLNKLLSRMLKPKLKMKRLPKRMPRKKHQVHFY